MHVAERMAFGKAAAFQQDQFLKAFEKFVAFARVLPAAQGVRGDRIGAGRAAKPKIDAAGKQRLQHLEALGDHQRRMVHQHHAARTDTNVLRRRRDLPDHDLRRGTGDAREVMMLGEPIALVAKSVRKPRQIERIAERHRPGRISGDGRQVEDGKRSHARTAGKFRLSRCERGYMRAPRQPCSQLLARRADKRAADTGNRLSRRCRT